MSTPTTAAPPTLDWLSDPLKGYLGRVTRSRARRGLPAPQVRVEAPDGVFTWGEQATPFHAASVGKLATTALTLQEVARGLDLATPIERLLPAAELEGLFDGPGATVEHLLGHTSGAADSFGDRSTRGPKLIKEVLDDREHLWSPAELIAYSREHQRPVGRPGERFEYSDLGFILLGRLLEERTGTPFPTLVRDRVFTPAGMQDSVMWRREPGPAAIAPLWIDRVEASTFPSVSVDWAGGGIVTTTADLVRLVTSVTDGTLVPAELVDRAAVARHRFHAGIHYGLGLMRLRFGGFSPFLRELPQPVGHLGILAVHAFRYPELDTTVALNFHGTREMTASFRLHIRLAQLLAKRAAE